MDLYLFRHGKAEERTSSVTSDSKRNLTEYGIKEINIISKSLKGLDVKIDYLISSPLNRSKQTANILSKDLLKQKKHFLIWDELKPEIPIEQIKKKIRSLNFSSMMLVGHEPNLSKLIGSIISDSSKICILLKKGGFAHIELFSDRSALHGTLKSLMTPKQIKKLCN
ncbi:MAG: Phosphohistidine phosphatase SixA [Nitrosopumilus sp.]|nr:Phosphohistidine phosphatase SixA [Candidatus Nitrosopumilus limneticus]MDC4222094.1 phosphohistidine phosphatase SixA [Candidatus Nitrosopumilus limneticus]